MCVQAPDRDITICSDVASCFRGPHKKSTSRTIVLSDLSYVSCRVHASLMASGSEKLCTCYFIVQNY